jgi:tyrosine-protein kinase Etk/Wzc
MHNRERTNMVSMDILDFLLLLARWKKFLLAYAGVISIAAILIALSLAKEYTATLTLLPPENEPDQLSQLMGSGGLLSGGGLSIGKIGGSLLSKASPLEDIYVAILQSRTMQMSIINRFNLAHVYKFDTKKKYFIEDVMRALSKRMDITVTDQGTLVIAVKDENPHLAADIAGFAARRLDEIYRTISTESVRSKRMFLEERLQAVAHDLDSCERQFAIFQKQNKMFDIEAQTKATIDEGALLEAQYLAEDLKYQVDKKVYLPDNPKIKEQETALAGLRTQRNSLADSRISDILIPLNSAPDLGLEFVRLKRNVRIQEILHSLIIQQYETAKIEEAKQTPRIQILDNAVPPEKRSKPKRSQFVIVMVCCGMIAGLVLVKVMETARTLKSDNSMAYQKCMLILQSVRHL